MNVYSIETFNGVSNGDPLVTSFEGASKYYTICVPHPEGG